MATYIIITISLSLYICVWIVMDVLADNMYIDVITSKRPAVQTIKTIHRIRIAHIVGQIVTFLMVASVAYFCVANVN